MESRDYTGEFESFLQEKADQYKLYPSDKVWNAINGKLHPRKKWSYLFVAAMFIGLGIGGKVHDSHFLQGLEQGADIETSSTNEFADLAPVLPINNASSLRKSGDLKDPAARESFARVNSTPAIHEASANAENLNLSVSGTSAENTDLSASTASQEFVRVIVADGEHHLTEANASSEPEAAEKIYAEHPASSLKEDVGNTFDEYFEGIHGESQRINPLASVAGQPASLGARDVTAARLTAPEKARSIKVLKPRHVNLGWQLYLSPTVSYRKLSGEGMKYFNGMIAASSPDVNNSVTHKPSIGFEVGTALTFATGRNFRLKTGLQLNINQYNVQAFYFTPEVAPLTRGGIGHTEINAISRYRNFNGFSKTWLTNKHIMMSLPLGAELTVFGNEKVKFNIAGTLQPTFVLNNQAYMISTNMKNYAQEPSLYRKFNMAAGAEAYLSIKAGSYKWMIGPQFRYHMLSSYKQEYPITEHLIDYGFKIGISR